MYDIGLEDSATTLAIEMAFAENASAASRAKSIYLFIYIPLSSGHMATLGRLQ